MSLLASAATAGTAIDLAVRGIGWAVGLLDAYLGREGTEKVLDNARRTLVEEGRPPSDAELLAGVEAIEQINQRIQES